MYRLASLAALALAATVCAAATPARPAAADNYGFDIDIALSKQAAATLATRHEQLFLFAAYYGDPNRQSGKYADEAGHIDLTTQSVTMTVPGRSGPVHFRGPQISARRLAMLGGPVMVNLNIASARKSSADNLLACDFIDGKLADVRKAPITLHCGLIDERPATSMKP